MAVDLKVYGASGVEASEANSYVTVAEAGAYFANRANIPWLQVPDKPAALVQATAYLDNRYRSRWRGTRATEEQALAWPRLDVTDEDGFDVAEDEIPRAVKEATYEIALRVGSGTNLYRDYDPTNPALTSRSVGVGPISKSESFDTPYRDVQPIFEIADRLLWAFITPARVNFVERA